MINQEETEPLSGRDQILAIKPEINVLDLETEEKYYKPLVTYTVNFVVQKFGKYLQPQVLENVRGLEDRIIVTNKGEFDKIRARLEDLDPNARKFDMYAFTLLPEGVLFFVYPEGALEKLFSPEDLSKMLSAWGKNKEQELREYSTFLLLADAIIHETLHQFHNPTLPYYFVEYAIPFYEKGVTEKLGLSDLISPLVKPDACLRAGVYKHLMRNLGEEVIHKIFFGDHKDIDPKTSYLALSSIRNMAEQYYPGLL